MIKQEYLASIRVLNTWYEMLSENVCLYVGMSEQLVVCVRVCVLGVGGGGGGESD